VAPSLLGTHLATTVTGAEVDELTQAKSRPARSWSSTSTTVSPAAAVAHRAGDGSAQLAEMSTANAWSVDPGVNSSTNRPAPGAS
jgi:hypothetical protein